MGGKGSKKQEDSETENSDEHEEGVNEEAEEKFEPRNTNEVEEPKPESKKPSNKAKPQNEEKAKGDKNAKEKVGEAIGLLPVPKPNDKKEKKGFKSKKPEVITEPRTIFETVAFSLVIIRNPFKKSTDYGRWLTVNETRGRGLWVPGGAVQAGESFQEAAKRQCFRETGMKIVLKGVLKVDYGVKYDTQSRMRVIFYAEPESIEETKKKKEADIGSEGTMWVTLPELEEFAKKWPGLRGPELVTWATYIEKGGAIYPLTLVGEEQRHPVVEGSMSFRLAKKQK